MKTYNIDVYVHIVATIEAESDSDGDIIDGLFPDGLEGEILDVTTNPNYLPEGSIVEI